MRNNLTTPAVSAEKLALISVYYQDRRTLRWWHSVGGKKRVTAIVSRVLRTTRSTTSSSWVTRHAGWHQLVVLRPGSNGKRWGTARSRVRARRSLDAVRVHVASCKSLVNSGSNRASSVRGCRLRARRLCELRRVARLYGKLCCARRHRACRLARPARRGIGPSGPHSQKPRSASRERGRLARRSACVRRPGGRFGGAARSGVVARFISSLQPPACTAWPRCLPGALASRGGPVCSASRRPGVLGSVGRMGACQHQLRACPGLGSGASAGANAHDHLCVLRRHGASPEGEDGGASREAELHHAFERVLRLRPSRPEDAAGAAPERDGHGGAGRLARLARDALVGCGASGAVDAAALRRGSPRAQGAFTVRATGARAVAGPRLPPWALTALPSPPPPLPPCSSSTLPTLLPYQISWPSSHSWASATLSAAPASEAVLHEAPADLELECNICPVVHLL